jgi:Tfp pilus assembly PilM family ATPase
LNTPVNISLGISFSSGLVRFTELIHQPDTTILNHTDRIEVDFDFEEDLAKYKSNQKVLTNISGELQKYFNKRKIQYTGISAVISTSQIFLITLPLDFSGGKQTINSKIYWELSNYFPETYADYVVNTYRLNSGLPSTGTDDFLIIAVHKNTLEFIKRIFKLCNIDLTIVDIDHFAAEHNLRKNYPGDLQDKTVLLLGLKKGRIDYGFITNKKYCYYTYTEYNSGPEFNLNMVRKLNSLLNGRFSAKGIDSAFIYGDDVPEDTVHSLKKIQGMHVQLLNPFENINSSAEILRNDELRRSPYRYAQSCGVALRTLSKK